MRGIEKLHPVVRARAGRLQALCAERGLPLLITDTLRTTAEQDALYAQGRTAPGSIVTNARGSSYGSPHQWGVAFDFCQNVKGREYSDADFFRRAGALGKSAGLFWGGDFRGFTDMPHFEDPSFMPMQSTASLRSQYGTPERFFETWAEHEQPGRTAANLIADGVAADEAYWRSCLYGLIPAETKYVRIIFDRYHSLLNNTLANK